MSTGYPRDHIGRYRVLRLLGRGGFGSVFLAEQTEPVKREVAVKVLNPGRDFGELRARFEIERETLNLMKHPGIAMLLDAGVTEDDQPFFVMEYAPGESILDFVATGELDFDGKLQLFRGVCDAVQHAHAKGVIHRDLTSNNVLVVKVDGRPQPKIIDFGIAKALGPGLLDVSMHTTEGMTMGTPTYMSPEQARGDIAQIDTRTDVYALGALLYGLLTGSLPFTEEEISEAGVRMFELICDKEPELPSRRVARAQHTAHLAPYLRGDLDWIVAKALAKERDHRYSSAAELSEDIRRYLEDEPVLASPPSKRYLLKKALMRHSGAVSAAILLLLSLIIGFVVSLKLYFESSANAATAQSNLERFNHLSEVLLLESLREAVGELGPAHPDNRDEMKSWLARADGLMDRTAELRALLSVPVDEDLGEAELRAETFLRRELTSLLAELEAFADAPDSPLANVRARLAWADEVQAKTVDAFADAWGDAVERVAADPRFAGFELVPQIGLVPLGPDPASGLEEFVALRTGAAPTRDPDTGALALEEGTGIVLVLVPGGSFLMGSQRADPAAPGFDAEAKEVESYTRWPMRPPDWRILPSRIEPPILAALRDLGTREYEKVRFALPTVALEPYLISKFEVTQAQWIRMAMGENPSVTGRPEYERFCDLSHPVENVTWERCREVLGEYAMDLPTESQWEFACRAGSTDVWFTGPDELSLQGYANLADITARDMGAGWDNLNDVVLEDGYVFTSPVGAFLPNAFGLHDTVGNVYELCLEPLGPYDPHRFSGPDGRRSVDENPDGTIDRVGRGGTYRYRAQFARSAHRWHLAAGTASYDFGVRPVRTLTRAPGDS